MRLLLIFTVTFLSAILTGCQTQLFQDIAVAIPPYKVEIIQGNAISKEQVSKLQIGMNQQQVRDVLGTPLLRSAYADRWDYVFTIKNRPGVPEQKRRITVYFKQGLLNSLDGDEILSEAELAATVIAATQNPRVPVLKATPAQLARWTNQQEWPLNGNR